MDGAHTGGARENDCLGNQDLLGGYTALGEISVVLQPPNSVCVPSRLVHCSEAQGEYLFTPSLTLCCVEAALARTFLNHLREPRSQPVSKTFCCRVAHKTTKQAAKSSSAPWNCASPTNAETNQSLYTCDWYNLPSDFGVFRSQASALGKTLASKAAGSIAKVARIPNKRIQYKEGEGALAASTTTTFQKITRTCFPSSFLLVFCFGPCTF